MWYLIGVIVIIAAVVAALMSGHNYNVKKKLDAAAEAAAFEAEKIAVEEKLATDAAKRIAERVKTVVKSHHKKHKKGVPRQY